MSDIDREILALRHFEELTNSEAAQVLDMSAQAASMRYVRALTHCARCCRRFPVSSSPEDRIRAAAAPGRESAPAAGTLQSKLESTRRMTGEEANFDAVISGLPVGRPADRAGGREPLEFLASEFLSALRSGKNPDAEDYAAAHPALASEIREAFPLLAAMEDWKAYRERHAFEHRSLDSLPSDRIGSFRIVREIGRGGMGIVFEAAAENSAQRVAIKVLPYLQSGPLRANFEREARTAQRLSHPHIVPVFGFGEHKGVCYYVMRLIHGVGLDWVVGHLAGKEAVVEPGSISARFLSASGPAIRHEVDPDPCAEPAPNPGVNAIHSANSPSCEAGGGADAMPGGAAAAGSAPGAEFRLTRTSWFEFARMGAQVADALRWAHPHGTLHRDAKPANLLLDSGGNVWVTDFGLARRTDALVDPDSPRAAGTLHYIAPEQLAGQVDVRSDVYSLGVTLFELLTRTPAFPQTEPKSLLEEIGRTQLPAPRDVNPRVPRELNAIVRKASAHDPAQRYASAGELWADLRRYLSGQRVRARGAWGWLPFGR